jgi:hypothetical protein
MIPLFHLAVFDASQPILPKGVGPLYLRKLSNMPLPTPPAAALSQVKTKRKREEEQTGKKDENDCLLPGLSPVLAPPRMRISRLRRPRPKLTAHAEIG